MAVIREGGTDPGSLKGRKGGTKGTHEELIFRVCYISFINSCKLKSNKKIESGVPFMFLAGGHLVFTNRQTFLN